MNKNFKLVFIFLGFLIPYLLVYKSFFLNGSLAFGDAPFFAPENLKELFNLPFTWNFRNDNFGSSQFYILWLYLPTYLYGILNHYLNFNNDILIRLIFYFPATILAILGSWKFIGKFNQNLYGKFLGSFLYGFNTYFLLLVDGGQVGISLAYGLFPFIVLFTLNYLQETNIKKFFYALFSLFILLNIDIRIGLISLLLSLLIWMVLTKNKEWLKLLRNLCLLGLSILGLCSYWIYPTLLNYSSSSFPSLVTNNNSITLLNSFFIFQPHFPLNQFGKLFPTPFYFCLLPVFILGNLIFLSKFKKTESKTILYFSLLFFLFVFISKGSNDPMGNILSWIVNHIPAGAAFRDTSKFYIPLILIGGLLLSFTISGLEKIIKNKFKWDIFILIVYGYLMILILSALSGSLNGVLGKINIIRDADYLIISNKINQNQDFFRSLYIEEKPAKFFGTFEKPVISGNSLYIERPFASMIIGKYDLYNFFHNQQLKQWFNLLGIKYIFFPENERKKILSNKEKKERQIFLNFVDKTLSYNKLNWGLSFPGYVNSEIMPHIFGQKKSLFIVGDENIYQTLFKDSGFKLQNQGLIFLEDGKNNPESLQKINPEDMTLIFFKKNNDDLLMSYFQKEMLSLDKNIESQWKFRNYEDYLTWKYDLLLNGIESSEFDYGKGVIFSTIANEKIKLKVDVPQTDNYYLSVRYTNSTSSAGLMVSLSNQEYNLINKIPQQFKWSILGPFRLNKGKLPLELTNKNGFVMLNTLVIISEKNLEGKEKEMNNLLNKTKAIYLNDNNDISKIVPLIKDNYLSIDYKQIDPTKYSISNLPKGIKWLIFSDHYNKNWQINNSLNFPFYSMINGFYIENTPSNFDLDYSPQKDVNVGIKFSLLSLGIICAISIYLRKRQ